MGEGKKNALRVDFDKELKPEFDGTESHERCGSKNVSTH